MVDVADWERRFVDAYIVKAKRKRYLEFLSNPKRRQKILERLNHALDYDRQCATEVDGSMANTEALVGLLKKHGADSTVCYLVADHNARDGTTMNLNDAAGELLLNHFGALIICPPKPIALYKTEDIGKLILFK